MKQDWASSLQTEVTFWISGTSWLIIIPPQQLNSPVFTETRTLNLQRTPSLRLLSTPLSAQLGSNLKVLLDGSLSLRELCLRSFSQFENSSPGRSRVSKSASFHISMRLLYIRTASYRTLSHTQRKFGLKILQVSHKNLSLSQCITRLTFVKKELSEYLNPRGNLC